MEEGGAAATDLTETQVSFTPQQPEEWKLHCSGFPKHYTLKTFKKQLQELKIEYLKAKKITSLSFGLVAFQNKENYDRAVELLSNCSIGGKKLVLKRSTKGEKRVRETENESETNKSSIAPPQKRIKVELQEEQESSADTKPLPHVNDASIPLWRLPYTDQLQQKEKAMQEVLLSIVKRVRSDSKYNLPHWLKGGVCPLEALVPSPVLEGYRNKVALTIGRNSEGSPQVGFALGRTERNLTAVGNIDECLHVSKEAKATANVVQAFVETSLPPYDKINRSGFWRQVEIRSNQLGHVMATIQVRSEGTDPTTVKEIKQRLAEHFETHRSPQLQLTSLFFQEHNDMSNKAPPDLPVEHLWGEPFICEQLLGMRFRISPNSFFQVNTAGAEILYKTIQQLCEADQDTCLLDVCCGTGTIGICMSKAVKMVVGLDIVKSAVEDAQANAEANGVENARFVLGPAETTLPSTLKEMAHLKCVAVVDPPRGGLHPNTIKAIRKCDTLKRLVYVSCNQKSLIADAGSLCRAASKTMHGKPFVPKRAIAVDMFPHTPHCEMVVLFERS